LKTKLLLFIYRSYYESDKLSPGITYWAYINRLEAWSGQCVAANPVC